MRIESRHCCAFSRPAGVGMPARFLVFLISATYVFLEAGCAHRMVIVPAATATAISGRKYAAEGHDAGVQIMADGNDWWGYPLDLPRIVTPMQVSIKNDSGKSLRIRYKDDSLVTSSGSVYYPIPPYRIRGEVTSAEPVTPAFAYNRFLIVPGYAPFYRWDFDDWGGRSTLIGTTTRHTIGYGAFTCRLAT